MGTIRNDQPLVPSVLDRLLDDDPGVGHEPPKARNQVLRELKQAVRRDLEHLLNTRRRAGAIEGFAELERSLVNYGIPDFVGRAGASAEARTLLVRQLEHVIRLFEPRFKQLKVEWLDNADPLDRTLRFRIDGLLHGDPAPEPVVFDSATDPTTATFEVKGMDLR